MNDYISIKGARTHNLKDISVNLPKNKLIVITGPSGSGKSSLAFDTIYAEGQRRYVESLSSYARQFLSVMPKPDVDSIDGLSPSIAIEQKSISHNPRSTVGTITEIYDYLRVLYARVGIPRCPWHKIPLLAQSLDEIANTLLNNYLHLNIDVLSPIVRSKKGSHAQIIDQIKSKGYVKIRLDGKVLDIDDGSITCDPKQLHSIDVIIDRLNVNFENKMRLCDAIENSMKLSDGLVDILVFSEIEADKSKFKTVNFSSRFACRECGYSLSEMEPRLFSFNSPVGACNNCLGLGFINDNLNCVACNGSRLNLEANNVFIDEYNIFNLCQLNIEEIFKFIKSINFSGKSKEISNNLCKEIHSRLFFLLETGLHYLTLNRRADTLSGGESQRIRLASQIGSGLTGVLYVLDEPSIGLHHTDHKKLRDTLFRLKNLGNTVMVVEHDEDTIKAADYVVDLGIGSGVHGGNVISCGTPIEICDDPNSITGAYISGRKIIKQFEKKLINPESLKNGKISAVELIGANGNNLKNVNLKIPLEHMVCVTGVSGSGKSSLIKNTLYPAMLNKISRENYSQGLHYREIKIPKIVEAISIVDQKPIGRTPRSNPATYTGLFTHIRELFAKTKEARIRGYAASRFSFNVKGGRCEACEGDGEVRVSMHFVSDIFVKCDVCKGLKYNSETLEVLYKGRNIKQILDMTVEEAYDFFISIPELKVILSTLIDVGLPYITLGQNAVTFSGGEAQRIRLSKELAKKHHGHTIYLLDEPTTGLHMCDIEKLLEVLFSLRDKGNTIIVIEHNLNVINRADWVIELGPKGGPEGGYIIRESSLIDEKY